MRTGKSADVKTLVEQATAAFRVDCPDVIAIEGEPVTLTPKQGLALHAAVISPCCRNSYPLPEAGLVGCVPARVGLIEAWIAGIKCLLITHCGDGHTGEVQLDRQTASRY
jgi:hypothetical protein